MPLSAFGVNSEYDIATPRTFACFKAKGGARAYFHGGLSPQELIIPAAVMVPHAEALVDGLPNTRLCVISEAGHMVNLEKPDEFNKAVLAFAE